ncbi:hypothetical protein KPL74_21775 [Bacillus sp. NP157]|nr:hypothetical protein KPL74_21775 [Bacillus sp. NP157]
MALELDVKALRGELQKTWQGVSADKVLSPVEFQKLRDEADKTFDASPAIAAHRASIRLGGSLDIVQQSADAIAEAMQQVALAARRLKLPDAERAALKDGTEYQIAYIVAAYKSSIERL